ncbi:hypothetical protein AAHA92_03002 [Salvia divinorum]|uniref:Uncharacterized protein n=1 Tax=Salvia divinorum TaxID=28513 RepID=A0ABD1IFN6_SALDI
MLVYFSHGYSSIVYLYSWLQSCQLVSPETLIATAAAVVVFMSSGSFNHSPTIQLRGKMDLLIIIISTSTNPAVFSQGHEYDGP